MIGLIALLLGLGVIPVCIGAIPGTIMKKENRSIGFMWIAGLVICLAVFQLVSVPVILLEPVGKAWFPYIVYGYTFATALLAFVGIFLYGKAGLWKNCLQRKSEGFTKVGCLLWFLALVLIGFQLFMSVRMTYWDGDDAFYVAVSTITKTSNTLYKLQPYSVGETALDIRHGLAPFPIWISYMARISDMEAVTVAHVVVGTVMIGATYVILARIGEELFVEKKIMVPLFLSFASLLILFGDYSFYTAENFLIARSRQGKAALANLVIPMLIYLYVLILKRVQENQKIEWMLWLMVVATVLTGCLCSTMGAFLVIMLIGIISAWSSLLYRRWDLVVKTAICCVPALVYVAGYMLA